MIYYELIKAMINSLGLAEMIINVVVQYYSFLELIINNRDSLFNLKFWCLSCYFFDIKQNFLQPSISKRIARLRSNIAWWKYISELSSIKSKITGQDSYLCRILYAIIQRMQVLITYISSLTLDIILTFPSKMTLILTQGLV